MRLKSIRSRTVPSRTPLFRSLRRLFAFSRLANQRNSPPPSQLLEMPVRPRVNRREFLKRTALASVAVGSGSLLTGCTTPETGPNAPRIAIVGGGIAGLNAAHQLRKRGWLASLFEASSRTGGRMFTAADLLNPGITTELGGEFVDSSHIEMFALAKEFDLEWLDVHAPGEANLIREAYFFNGTHFTEAQVVDAFRPIAPLIEADFNSMGEIVDFEHDGGATELDRLSLSDYLDRIGARGWIRKLLEIAFVTEFGLECFEQSALNMIFMISTDLSAGRMELFGDSDERFKIAGGNQRITEELARRVHNQIHLEHRLIAVSRPGTGFRLTFDHGGRTVERDADFVLLTLPFTMLRDVEMNVEMPPWKRKAIDELGYGMNAKLMLGMSSRFWRNLGQSGNIFSDEPFQLAWDSSRMQPGTAGAITCYTGGIATDALRKGTPLDQAGVMTAALEKAFPGFAREFNGRAERFDWPSHRFTRASYACYKPGQWTTIANAESRPVGNLFFAGEHCSYDFQGFMNGGAATGKQAALRIMKALRQRVAV